MPTCPQLPRTWCVFLATAITAGILALPSPAAAAFEFTSDLYGSPTVDTSGPLLASIDVPNPPGGLFFRTTGLQPGQEYRLTIDGSAAQGQFAFRLRIDDGPYVYRWAPDVEVIRVAGGSSLEVLIYTDSDGRYSLRALDLEECGSGCGDDADLKQEVLAGTPGLADALERHDTWTAAQLIKDWVAPRVPVSSAGTAVLAAEAYGPAELYYDYFEPAIRGVYCGGMALFLKQVLGLFGIESFTVDFGNVVGGLTHVTVVVPVGAGDGTGRYRILDPTFDLAPTVATTGDPVTVPELLELWRQGLIRHVDLGVGAVPGRLILTRSGVETGITRTPCATGTSSACAYTSWLAAFRDGLSAQGLSTDTDALVELLGTTSLFNIGRGGVPEDFKAMHDAFRHAVTTGDDGFHLVSRLPLPPLANSSPVLSGAPTAGMPMVATPPIWHPFVEIDSSDVSWSRCTSDGGECVPIPEATGSEYVVPGEAESAMFKVTYEASNPFGVVVLFSELVSGRPVDGTSSLSVAEAAGPPVTRAHAVRSDRKATRRVVVRTRAIPDRRRSVVRVRLRLVSHARSVVRVSLRLRGRRAIRFGERQVTLVRGRTVSLRVRVPPGAIRLLRRRVIVVTETA